MSALQRLPIQPTDKTKLSLWLIAIMESPEFQWWLEDKTRLEFIKNWNFCLRWAFQWRSGKELNQDWVRIGQPFWTDGNNKMRVLTQGIQRIVMWKLRGFGGWPLVSVLIVQAAWG